ncbi:Fcf1-domain-containing protein [Microdochium trichocladiopsis]|uniref:U three protein 23 n=1 Tax=Microdochium trichocladiopsis TaxID=1682393 RepID=A0A9P9BMW5_9PEZI|nr:Fcf1-domain-containing protein [Microdochium trichocladiopsis]KAH7026321.1 Fcf1-domain-containing protein [Microdochium trichocladiopsis]
MPRAKRSKDNRKLMEKFSMNFGFRKPYQVLMDADFVIEGTRCKMEIVKRLEDNLHARGDVKPMITQCSMRHLYARKTEPGVDAAIEEAKNNYERRRCGHHPDQYPEPLSAFECVRSVVDPKDSGVNKHHYICAVNDDELRASLREVAGVPLLYIRRSVMTLEPMAEVSAKARSREERSKFRAEIKKVVGDKRKRTEDDDEDSEDEKQGSKSANPEAKKRKKTYGQKLPNPLSIKKKKPQPSNGSAAPGSATKSRPRDGPQKPQQEGGEGEAEKKKRKRKPKNKSATDGGAEGSAPERAVQVEAPAA